MFTNEKRQAERTGKYGTPRHHHLHHLVTQFQHPSTTLTTKQTIVANLANFSYDPYNYPFLRDLNVLELFIDCLSEPDERLVEFAAAGICNAVAAPENARVVCECGGVEGLIGCLWSPVKGTVKYGFAGLFYLWEFGGKGVVLGRGDVVELVKRYTSVEGFCHLAQALLDKIVEG